ncbi:hypothetical protein DVH24_012095 [Malus domestica]|uniref:Uncharacterized protein n=1 Tax=Malus domestica TaxID=3750 RepID=A0A498HTF2_MALDO|nr:hypothetical protein DVH24_012095 [Malus domestica]
MRLTIRLSRKKPVYVFFKNTKPSTDTLMSAIDEENRDEDDFVHISYSGSRREEGASLWIQ